MLMVIRMFLSFLSIMHGTFDLASQLHVSSKLIDFGVNGRFFGQ